MKSSIFKISLALALLLVVVGVSRVGAFTTTSFYPGGAPVTDGNVLRIQQSPQAKLGPLGIGRTTPPTGSEKLDVLGGLYTTGASIAGNAQITGRLRINPTTSGTAPITEVNASTTTGNAGYTSDAVSVRAGHIVYDAKKPATTRVLCTDTSGIIAPCGDVEDIIISGAGYTSIVTKNRTISYASIQGNQAALSGLLTVGGQQTASTGCGYNSSWGGTSPFPLSVTAKTGC